MTLSTPIKELDCTSVKIVVIYLKKEGCDLLQNQFFDPVKVVQVMKYKKMRCITEVDIH